MHVRLSPDAEADLASLKDYLEPRNPRACDRVLTAIFTTMRQLESFPLLGREGRAPGTREAVVPGTPFIIFYTIADQFHVDIERVLHGRRKWPTENSEKTPER